MPRTPAPTPNPQNPYQVATIPTVAQLQTDFSDQHYPGGSIPTTRVMPVMPAGNPNVVSAVRSVIVQSVQPSTTVTNITTAAPATGPRPNTSPSGWHYFNASTYLGAISAGWIGVGMNIEGQNYSNGANQFGLAATATEPVYILQQNLGINSGNASSGALVDLGMFARTNFPNTWGTVSIPLLVNWMSRVVVGPGLNQARTWVGMQDSNGGGSGSPNLMNLDSPTAWNFIGFRYAPATAGDQFWQIFVGGAVAPVIISTGVPVDGTSTGHVFEIQGSGGNLTFLIDSVKVGTVATGSAFTNMFMTYLWADNNDNTSRVSLKTYGYGAWVIGPGSNNLWQAMNSGETGASNPLPASPSPLQQVTDGGVTWQFYGNAGVLSVPTRIGMAYAYWE